MEWFCKTYNELSLDEFHDLIALRIEVFVVEQDCPYQELDGKDKISIHVFATDNNQMVATTRIVPPGISYEEPSIGRVVVAKSHRGTGLGHKLMRKTMEVLMARFGHVPVRISAQEHLIDYYNHHEFRTVSEMYLEDNIPHVQMLYTP